MLLLLQFSPPGYVVEDQDMRHISIEMQVSSEALTFHYVEAPTETSTFLNSVNIIMIH